MKKKEPDWATIFGAITFLLVLFLMVFIIVKHFSEMDNKDTLDDFQGSFERIYKNTPGDNCKIIIMLNSTVEVINDEEHSESYIRICEVGK